MDHLSHPRELRSISDRCGPSPAVVAWWRFLIETLVCVVLVAAIVVIGLNAGQDLLAGPAVVALAGMIVGIVRYGDRT
jgi:hypothetical protein